MDLTRLGQTLRKRREELGIPAATLARRAGIGRTTLYAWERGEGPKTKRPVRPERDKLEQLTLQLGIYGADRDEILRLAGYEHVPHHRCFDEADDHMQEARSSQSRVEMLAAIRQHLAEVNKLVEQLLQDEQRLTDNSTN